MCDVKTGGEKNFPRKKKSGTLSFARATTLYFATPNHSSPHIGTRLHYGCLFDIRRLAVRP